MFPNNLNQPNNGIPSMFPNGFPSGDWSIFPSMNWEPSSNFPSGTFSNSFGAGSSFSNQASFMGASSHTPIQTSFNGDKFYPNGKKLYDRFHKDFFHENGQKAYDGFHKHFYYENGKQAYDGFHHTIFYPSGEKAYDGFFNRAYHTNGKEMNGDGIVTEPMFYMNVQGKNGEFALQLSHNFFAKVHMQNRKMQPNLFLDGVCVV